jgi:hypothetical protein
MLAAHRREPTPADNLRELGKALVRGRLTLNIAACAQKAS